MFVMENILLEKIDNSRVKCKIAYPHIFFDISSDKDRQEANMAKMVDRVDSLEGDVHDLKLSTRTVETITNRNTKLIYGMFAAVVAAPIALFFNISSLSKDIGVISGRLDGVKTSMNDVSKNVQLATIKQEVITKHLDVIVASFPELKKEFSNNRDFGKAQGVLVSLSLKDPKQEGISIIDFIKTTVFNNNRKTLQLKNLGSVEDQKKLKEILSQELSAYKVEPLFKSKIVYDWAKGDFGADPVIPDFKKDQYQISKEFSFASMDMDFDKLLKNIESEMGADKVEIITSTVLCPLGVNKLQESSSKLKTQVPELHNGT